MKLTDEQEQVINSRNCNLLVSAAAGSGKTAVLVERIIKKVTDAEHPIGIDELLVVTFTKAAAAQMKERISDAIGSRLRLEPGNVHLQKQVTLVKNAKIMTIDSFCLDVIRNYFHHIELDPGFAVANEAELTLMKSDVLDGVVEEYYKAASEEFIEFIECYAPGRSDERLMEYVFKLYDLCMGYPWPMDWLENMTRNYEYDGMDAFYDSPLINDSLRHIKGELEEAAILNDEAMEACKAVGGPYMYGEALQDDKSLVSWLMECDTYADMAGRVSDVHFTTLSRKRDERVTAELREKAKGIRDDFKKIITDIKKNYFFESLEEMYDDVRSARASMKVLCDMTRDFMCAFSDMKRERNVIDFDDMEHFALEILVGKDATASADMATEVSEEMATTASVDKTVGMAAPTRAALDLQSQYAEIMIDEYQDSNYVQELLLTSITRERNPIYNYTPNMFMVGDVKQSIYKFRMAKPELFMEKYDTYESGRRQVNKNHEIGVSDVYESDGQLRNRNQRVDLNMNFRSRRTVIDSVNALFGHIMKKDFGGIDYDDDARLNAGASYDDDFTGYETELLLIMDDTEGMHGAREKSDNDTSDKDVMNYEDDKDNKDGVLFIIDSEDYRKAELEAYGVAKRIKELTDPDKGMFIVENVDGRDKVVRARLKDVVILLRTMVGWSELFVKVLTEEGIMAHAETKSGYFMSVEIKTMLSLLKILDNPRQDIPFAAVLRSPFVGLDVEEMAEIRANNKNRCIYESVLGYIGDDEKSDNIKKLKTFMELYADLRGKSTYLKVSELIKEILNITKYDYYCLASPSGDQRYRNLKMLAKQAAMFEESSYHGLFQFIRYMERLNRYEIDYGEGGGLSERDDAVRIMSIHKSKGLEFPIVFVAGLSKRFNQLDSKAGLILHPELGIGCDYVDYKMRTKVPTLVKTMVRQKIILEGLSEEVRILYVAMTRAKEKLIMSAYVDDIIKSVGKWHKDDAHALRGVEYRINRMLKAGCFMDYIGAVVIDDVGFNDHIEAAVLKGEGIVDYARGRVISGKCFQVRVFGLSDIINAKSDRYLMNEMKLDDFKGIMDSYKYDDAIIKELVSEIEYKYAFAKVAELPIKLSVSGIKKLSTQDGEGVVARYDHGGPDDGFVPLVPDFISNKKVTSASDVGTLYHRVMERVDFKELIKVLNASMANNGLTDEKTYIYIINQLTLLCGNGRITAEERDIVMRDMSKLKKFFEGELARRMAYADLNGKLYRERRFVVNRPAIELNIGYEEDENILVQGMFDAYFEEGGDVVLVDYKTDFVPYYNDESMRDEYLIKKYKTQVFAYEDALRKLTGRNVREIYIYSFHMSRAVGCYTISQ